MTPALWLPIRVVTASPRRRGDDPTVEMLTRREATFSPQARG